DRVVQHLVTRLQIDGARANRRKPGQLAVTDRRKIEHHVSQLRDRINTAPELSDGRKKTLNKKLNELLGVLKEPNVTAIAILAIVASITTAVKGTEDAIIKLPETITAISRVLGMANAAMGYDEPKQITDASEGEDQGPENLFNDDLDDEIPF